MVDMAQIQSSEEGRSAGESPAAALRRILASPGVHQGPACFDALSARLVEQAGFGYTFMSGQYYFSFSVGCVSMIRAAQGREAVTSHQTALCGHHVGSAN